MTKFPELVNWQRQLEASNHAIYHRNGWAIHCWMIDDEIALAELRDSDGYVREADGDADIGWLAQLAAELEENDHDHDD